MIIDYGSFLSRPTLMDGPGHLLSLKVMRLSVRVCSNNNSRLFVIFVSSSDPLSLVHGNRSTPVPPLFQPTPPRPYSLYRVVPPSQATPRLCAT